MRAQKREKFHAAGSDPRLLQLWPKLRIVLLLLVNAGDRDSGGASARGQVREAKLMSVKMSKHDTKT